MIPMTGEPLNYLITGAARGIGRGLSRLLVHRGHRVFLVDEDSTELRHTYTVISDFVKATPTTTGRVGMLRCNLRQRDEIELAVREAATFFQGNNLDVIVNNAAYTAGVGGPSLLASYPRLEDAASAGSSADDFADSWHASVQTNLTAPVLLSRACLQMLRKDPPRRPDGGCIVHMSSTRAHQSEPDSEGYAATKAGFIGLTHSMAFSLAPVGVRVNAILPGWIDVANECKSADEAGVEWGRDLEEEEHGWHLNGRVGRVEDILAAVEYLANARFVTGTETVVDGGVTRKMVYPE